MPPLEPTQQQDAQQPPQEKKKKKKRGPPTQQTYLAKIAKKYLGENGGRDPKTNKIIKNPDQLTITKSAIGEVEMLMNDGISTILHNADKMLTYSGHRTFGKKTAEGATYMALSGLLRTDATKAGEKAVSSYDNWVAPEVPAA
tara:strand:- start:537 stop:965 length:429 start_codon:yes stop_codon:yes gene_type:complete